MFDRDQMNGDRQKTGVMNSQPASPEKLPAAIQSIIDQNWEALRPALEKEELLTALECFSQYMYQQPVLPSAKFAFSEQTWWEVIRQFFERSELVHMLCATDDEVRYRFDLFADFFEQAFHALNARQRQVVRLSASAAYSAAEIAKTTGFHSVAKMLAFQRRAFCAIATTLSVLFSLELKQPEVESRRRAALRQWHEVFAKKATI